MKVCITKLLSRIGILSTVFKVDRSVIESVEEDKCPQYTVQYRPCRTMPLPIVTYIEMLMTFEEARTTEG